MTEKLTLEELAARLQVEGIANIDPVSFAYTQSLINRIRENATSSSELALRNLSDKAHARALDYLDNAERLRSQARESLATLDDAGPEFFQRAQNLFDAYQFTKLARLVKRHKVQKQSVDRPLTSLRELTNGINLAAEVVQRESNDDAEANIEQLLAQQEQHAKVDSGELNPALKNGPSEQLELRSMKYFRESMKHFNVDKTIARAIIEEPQNPGPLNPHMIAIRGLTKMQELSPAYTRRFTGYIETLLWLEKNLNKLNSVPLKKSQ